MATAAEAAPGLTDQQLREILGLIEGADSVELKLTVPDEDQRSTGQALELDPLDSYLRADLLLRHPRAHPEQGGRGGAGSPLAGKA